MVTKSRTRQLHGHVAWKGADDFGDLSLYERIILKWNGFVLHRTRTVADCDEHAGETYKSTEEIFFNS
jgi:hypothetical protein